MKSDNGNPTMRRTTPRTRWGGIERTTGMRANYDVAFHPVGTKLWRYWTSWSNSEAEAIEEARAVARIFNVEIEIDGVVQPANPGQRRT